MVNTGAAISFLPPNPQQMLIPRSYKVQAVNGTKIDTFREKILTVSSRNVFEFSMDIPSSQHHYADIGCKLLAHFNLSVNMAIHSLTDNQT